jgi:gamma-glutamylcysteine synthetase
MENKFKHKIDLVDAAEHIKEKIAFMGEVMAALALRTETAGFSDNALCGLYQIFNEMEQQAASLSEAIQNEWHNNFCETVEAGIKSGIIK